MLRRPIATALAAALLFTWAPNAIADPPPAVAPEQLQPGVTTYSQVIAALGEPDSVTARAGGVRSIKYGVTPAHERLLTFVPLVKFFVDRCRGCPTTVVLVFSPAGTVVSWSMQRNSAQAPAPPAGQQTGASGH